MLYIINVLHNAVSSCHVLLEKSSIAAQFVSYSLSYVAINAAVLLHFMTETRCASQASDFLGFVSKLTPIMSSFSSLSASFACPFLSRMELNNAQNLLACLWTTVMFETSPSQHICPNLQHFLSYWISLSLSHTHTHTHRGCL